MEENDIGKLKRQLDSFRKHPNHRTSDDIQNIMELTSSVGFFEKITSEKKSDFIHREACKHLRLQIFQKGEFVVHFGEIGQDFYILLKGKVSVMMPSKVVKNFSVNYTEKDLRKMLTKSTLEHQESLNSEVTKTEEGLKQIFIDQLANQISILKRADSKLNLKFLRDIGRIDQMKEVCVMKEGESFGELALISEKPRAASIVCKELCIFATLSKQEFSRILSKEAERVLQEKTEFLQKLPLFSSTPKSILVKLSFYFTEMFFHKKQVVYKAGQEIENVYFVKSGEFKLAKRKFFKSKPVISQGKDTLLKFANVREIQQGIDLQFSIKTKNEIFGQEELIENKTSRDYSAACISTNGVLYSIPVNDFQTKISNPDSKKFLQTRQDYIMQRSFHLSNTEKMVTDIRSTEHNKLVTYDSIANTEEFQEMREKLKKLREKVKKSIVVKDKNNPWAYPNNKAKSRRSSADNTSNALNTLNTNPLNTLNTNALNSPNSPNTPHTATFSLSPKKYKNRLKEKNKDKNKALTSRTPRTARKIKRVPPPNFMIGMREYSRLFGNEKKSNNTTRRVLSS